MDASGQLHAPADLPPEKEPLVPIGRGGEPVTGRYENWKPSQYEATEQVLLCKNTREGPNRDLHNTTPASFCERSHVPFSVSEKKTVNCRKLNCHVTMDTK